MCNKCQANFSTMYIATVNIIPAYNVRLLLLAQTYIICMYVCASVISLCIYVYLYSVNNEAKEELYIEVSKSKRIPVYKVKQADNTGFRNGRPL